MVTNSAGRSGQNRVVLFVSGDDAEAKAIIANLISAIGFEPFDLGGIAQSAQQQPEGAYYGAEFYLRDGHPVREVLPA